jgi:hypothetical protein
LKNQKRQLPALYIKDVIISPELRKSVVNRRIIKPGDQLQAHVFLAGCGKKADRKAAAKNHCFYAVSPGQLHGRSN